MLSKERFYPEMKFGGYSDIDGTMAFYNRVNSLLQSSFVVLDVGCGTGANNERLVPYKRAVKNIKGKVRKIIGIDVDVSAQQNKYVDEFHLIQNETWPIETNSIDLIVTDNVVEHLADPDLFFREAKRVLANSGYICIRTPNKWSYIGIASRLIPNKYHSRVTSVVQEGRKEADVFPTLYKCNTVRSLRRMLKKNGFDCVVYGYEAEPTYLAFSKIAFSMGVLYHKIVPGFMKSGIFAFGKVQK